MKDKINDIFNKCRNDKDINKIVFLYNGKPFDGNLSISKIINRAGIDRNKMLNIQKIFYILNVENMLD